MSDRLFTPVYKVEDVDYVSNNKNGKMSVEPSGYAGPKTLDPNKYATKKTIAQGMLDVALLTANASQLKYVLTVGEAHAFYTLMLSLISVSLVLQVAVGVLFLIVGGMNINSPNQQKTADILNNIILVMVFIISLVNVVLSAFGIEQMNMNPPGLLWNNLTTPK